MDYLGLILRWIHLLSAVTLVGGAVFSLLVLRPWLSSLPEQQQEEHQQQLRRRWAPVVFTTIGLLLLTGLVNIMRINPQLPEAIKKTYHPLLGIKVLVALGAFFLASALAGRSEAFQSIRRRGALYLGVAVLLGVLVILISGYLRVLRDSAGREPVPSSLESPKGEGFSFPVRVASSLPWEVRSQSSGGSSGRETFRVWVEPRAPWAEAGP